MPITNIVEILERTQTGEYCTQKDWDTKRIPQTIRAVLKRHGLEKTCDQQDPLWSSDTSAPTPTGSSV
jgi:hypothetical protein